jgi:protein SCO1/2
MKTDFTFKSLLGGLLGVLLLAVAGLIVIDLSNRSRSNLPEYAAVPEFKFTERSGAEFRNTDMEGKINIVNFFFTNCLGPCPVMNANVAELYKKFRTTDRVQFISISVDPERDSLAVLQKYAERFGVNDQRWLFLRGPIEEVKLLSERGFMLAGDLPGLHSINLVLVDDRGMIRGYYSSTDEDALKVLTVHVRELLKGIDGLE